ncbi:hypothetical protein MLDJOKPK_00264 [Salmonella phage SPAsTU]|nr:hypothetical protein STsAS_152 [Salmonella phage STsAS]AXF51128.1 hypothetical protein MLDJOKPK_00264 [Salmonella phage SPAsTU]
MLSLLEVRNDVWQSSIRDDPEWSGIEEDLPNNPDQMLVFLYDRDAKVVRGIFERTHTNWATTLNCICCGVSELDPQMFVGYNARKVHTPLLSVCVSPELRISGMVPNLVRLQDASGVSDKGDTEITITTPRVEDAIGLVECAIERGLKENVMINNLTSIPLDKVLQLFESATCHLLESKTYHFKGAL